MQFVSFYIDGGALAYFKREDIHAIVEDKNSPNYTYIYIRGHESGYRVKGHYREILDDLGIKP